MWERGTIPLLMGLLIVPVLLAGCIEEDEVEGQADIVIQDVIYTDFRDDYYSIMVTVHITNDLNRELHIDRWNLKLLTMDGEVFEPSEIDGSRDIEVGDFETFRVWWNRISKDHMADSVYLISRFEGGQEIRSEDVQLPYDKVFLRHGLFSVRNSWDERIRFTDPQAVAAGNFNEDGELEIAVVDFGESSNAHGPFYDTNYYWVNDGLFIEEHGPSELKEPDNSTRLGNGTCGRDVAVGDIDLDGLHDLAACYWNSNSVEIFLQRSDRSFDKEPDFVLNTGIQPHNLTIQDIDHDGLPDIAVLSGHTRLDDVEANLSVYLQKKNGFFSSEPDVFFRGVNGYFSFHDLLGDGDLELLFGSTIYSFDLEGVLTEEFRFNTSRNGMILIDDIDGRGPDDVMIGSELFLRSDGEGLDQDPFISFEVIGRPLAADMDGNGAIDIIIGNDIFFQDLDRTFDTSDTKRYGFEGSINWIGDMDLDGDLDILTISGDDILVYHGDRDTDKDGFLDAFDWFPYDPSSWDPRGIDGIS